MNRLFFLVLLLTASLAFSQSPSPSVFFVENEGQWPGEFSFKYNGGGGTWFVTNDGLTIDLKQYEHVGAPHAAPALGFPPLRGGTEGGSLFDREPQPTRVKGHVLKANLVRNDPFRAPGDGRLGGTSAVGAPHAAPVLMRGGESPDSPHPAVLAACSRPVIEGQDKLTSYSNYFLGQDKSKWRGHVGHYSKVIAKEVWPGIDVEYEAKKQGVETFFRVKPGADIDQIQIEYEGLDAPLFA